MCMLQRITLTLEELGLCMMLCGYEEAAAGLVKPTLGEKTDPEWEAIFETASHSLLAKGVWDIERQKQEKIPLKAEIVAFISSYIESSKMLRFTKEKDGTEEYLMFHSLEEDEWIYHHVWETVCHDFSLVKTSQLQGLIDEFYGVEPNALKDSHSITVPEEVMVTLSQENLEQSSVEQLTSLVDDRNQELFSAFLQDLKEYPSSIDNVSVTYLPSPTEYPTIMDVMFILPHQERLWVISQHDEEQNRPIYLTSCSYQEWIEEVERRIGMPMPVA